MVSASERSWMRRIFSTVFGPHEPAFTVGSFAISATVRPSTVPTPVSTHSAPRGSASERPLPRGARVVHASALAGALGVRLALGVRGAHVGLIGHGRNLAVW